MMHQVRKTIPFPLLSGGHSFASVECGFYQAGAEAFLGFTYLGHIPRVDFFEREFPEIAAARATAVVMIKRIQSRLRESAERHEETGV